MIRTKTALAIIVLGASFVGAPALAADISGRWSTPAESIVEFLPCAQTPAKLCGRIIWLKKPHDAAGRIKTDGKNPDHAARSRPIVGLTIVSGLTEASPGVWSGGALYNPEDGRTYAGEIRLKGANLELKGCALKFLCKSQVWRRA